MPQTRIPQAEWKAFCELFSRQHRGWLVTLTTVDTRLLETDPDQSRSASETIVDEAALEGISTEHSGGTQAISIIAGKDERRISHQVPNPQRLSLIHSADGEHKGLRVDGGKNQTTTIRFRVPARPETVDGLAESEK